jgi:hypothetical protein
MPIGQSSTLWQSRLCNHHQSVRKDVEITSNERRSCRVGPHREAWANILTEDAYFRVLKLAHNLGQLCTLFITVVWLYPYLK